MRVNGGSERFAKMIHDTRLFIRKFLSEPVTLDNWRTVDKNKQLAKQSKCYNDSLMKGRM
ncbi:MAG: hypothetical protein A2161_18245 [Candidatus Schekmanbacteria bacterium RBG_13_48_7]|uniref:Uncharacterized protein n=1 Tax=Candidatus Schekmanbacteria bacterium RBG_13_48_7 TaxID=1817878 RepID=A0A1F7S1Z4_9BACT|nr:MAG: hypothetical protein A2161_18245 [Candidatus Schekmanbacteria bacterium RBG_13_48_7]